MKDSVQIIVWDLTTAYAAIDQSSCPGANVLTLAGNEPNYGNGETGLWQVVGTNHGVSFTDATLYNTTISLDPSACGVTTLRWTIFGSNSCTMYDDVQITNYGGVTPVSAGTNQTLGACYSSTSSSNLSASYRDCVLNVQSEH